MDNNRLACVGIAVIGAGILLYIAQQSAGDGLQDVPKFESEMQFAGLSADAGGRVNAGTPLDMSPDVHFYVPGYNCAGQKTVLTQHRYPAVSGGNMTAVMNHGMTRLSQGSPDNDWRVQPPSEVTI